MARVFVCEYRIRGLILMAFAVIVCTCGGVVKCEGNSQLTQTSGCVCPGFDVLFTCSIVGGGNTIWNGSAFNCPSASDSNNNKIILRHSGFGMQGNSIGMCNGGVIVGRGVSINGTCYTSQLSVRVNSSIVGQNVSCFYDNLTRETLIGISTIVLTSGDELPLPQNISLVGASPSELTFKWDPVTHNCSALHYNIMMTGASCGSCPMITNSTTVTCLIQQLQQNEVRLCTFRVQGVLCGNISGQPNEANFSLRVPGVPMIKIVPTYSQRERILTSLHVTIMKLAPFSISSVIDGSTMFYNINYTNSTSGELCGSVTIPSSLCANDVCIHEFNISSSLCSPSTALSVIVFASNILGDGEISEELTFDMINNFVDVSFNDATKRFTCTFTNKQDLSEKSCSITLYRDCKQREILIAQANSTDSQITLVPNGLQSDSSIYCYVVTASNETLTLNLTGSIGQIGVRPNSNTGATIAGGILGAVALLAIIVLILGLAIRLYPREKRDGSVDALHLHPREKHDDSADGTSATLIPVKDDRFIKLKVEKDCELRAFIEAQKPKLIFQMGAAFYEFTRAQEDVNSDKEVILMDKETEKLYTGKAAYDMIAAPEGRINRPNLPKYRVFVQSQGIGYRPLGPNSLVLYERNAGGTDANKSHKSKPDHTLVKSERFKKLEVTRDCELREFIDSHELTFKPGCAFFEFINEKEDINEKKEVLLMDKVTGDIFTGPSVLSEIGAPGRDIERPSLAQYRVFIQSFYGARLIHEGSTLLYEYLGSDTDELEPVDSKRLKKLDVKKTCNLRDFVEKTHKLIPYKPRRFFFEFVGVEEEITDDKEIILMDKGTKKLFTGLKAKEMIGAGAPDKKVKTPSLEKFRVFVQNGGGGYRCLKAGTSILYERSYQF